MSKELQSLIIKIDKSHWEKEKERKQINRCIDVIKERELKAQKYDDLNNANLNEALEVLGFMGGYIIPTANGNKYLKDFCDREFTTIKQALLKAQEPKHYLKWEDLEFKEEEQTMKVKLNNKIYTMFYCSDEVCFDTVVIGGVFIDSCSQQFFNDLHLERVEE